jgi:3-dehydroquinate synthase
VPVGERTKRSTQLARLWDHFADLGLGRDDLVVALGGGMVGDLAGFAAATWMRGVAWIVAPTSLLAQVDSSVGGKTAIDLPAGKNLVGAFHQPVAVVVDPDLLATLPRRHLRAGMAEVIKMGMAVDGALFAWLERNAAALAAFDPRALEGAVRRALAAKLRVVRRDERERRPGVRTSLNYGHTLGHALEAARAYRGVLHGEAVAIGMRAAATLSVRRAGLADGARARQNALLDRFGLPRRMPPTSLDALLTAMRSDKKRGARGGHDSDAAQSIATTRWVLTPRVGHASVPRRIEARLVRETLIEVGAQP